MGVDIPDVRAVIYYRLSSDIECYYQESGRAGRDSIRAVLYKNTGSVLGHGDNCTKACCILEAMCHRDEHILLKI